MEKKYGGQLCNNFGNNEVGISLGSGLQNIWEG